MSLKNNVAIIAAMFLVCAILFAANLVFFKKEALPAWKKDFSSALPGKGGIPDGWVVKGKPGTKQAVFSVVDNAKGGASFLHMEADSASASLITKVDDVDLKKTPILRWQWRMDILPQGADGRIKSKDDQAISIYVGTGSAFNNKSISYRWDTETPKESEGNCSYGLGAVKIKWHTLRNKEDRCGRWFIEERNVAEDFKNAWGFYPDTLYISISCNSQYTRSQADADLGWIEFVSPKGKPV